MVFNLFKYLIQLLDYENQACCDVTFGKHSPIFTFFLIYFFCLLPFFYEPSKIHVCFRKWYIKVSLKLLLLIVNHIEMFLAAIKTFSSSELQLITFSKEVYWGWLLFLQHATCKFTYTGIDTLCSL